MRAAAGSVRDDMTRARELAAIVRSGEAMLFTGAGFSAGACARDGTRLPDSPTMVRELWTELFGPGDPDDSTLADLYDVALLRAPDRLREYLARRLRIGDAPLPAVYARWFGAPWRRIYTLNVDDLEVAVARQFPLPRPLRSVSALAPEPPPPMPGALDVVHLNGLVGDDPRAVTFSTMQYAARLCSREHEYDRLVDDLRTAPFVFVGTTLDQAVLWQHVELHRRADGDPAARPGSYLISPSLSCARQVLLASHGIEWLRGTAAELADHLLQT